MHFIDRAPEMRRLERLTHQPEGGLAVIWGRRRVGKTRLLLEWVRKHHGVYWVADESAVALQRLYFAQAVATRLPGFAEVDYRDWSTFFNRLTRDALQAGWRGPLVIDELPYLIQASPELPSVLQRFVDHDARNAKLVVALAGSSQRMMQGLVLDAAAPLYGRATESMKLSPIAAPFLGDALSLDDPRAVVEAYSAFGGIPRYWELAAGYANVADAVDALVLDPLGPLHEEPARLLLEETPSATSLRPLLEAIGSGSRRVSEMASRLGLPVTSLSRPLQRLQELDLVEREIPFGESERTSKRALYGLSDPLMRLWFTLVASRRSMLLQASRKARLRLAKEALPGLFAATWELLCRQATPLLGDALGDIELGPARRFWHGQGPEWDVVSESADGSVLLVGEAKWSVKGPTAAFVEQTARELVSKGVPSVRRGAGGQVHYGIFVVAAPPRRLMSLPNHVHVIDASAVLRALRQQ